MTPPTHGCELPPPPDEASAAWRAPSAAAEAGQALLVIGLFVVGGLCVAAGPPLPGFGAFPPLEVEVRQPAAAYPLLAMLESKPDPDRERDGAPDAAAGAASLPRRWLIDGFNLLHTALLGGQARGIRWWDELHRRRVVDAVSSYADAGAELIVVFDGRQPDAPHADAAARAAASRPLQLRYAPSADEWVLRELRSCADPAAIGVVTADRRLAARARSKGAQVEAPISFLRRCR